MKLALKLPRRNPDAPRRTLRERATALKASAAKVMRRPQPALSQAPSSEPDFLAPPLGFVATFCGGTPRFAQAEAGLQWEAQRLFSTATREYYRRLRDLPDQVPETEWDAANARLRHDLRLDALRRVAFGPSSKERANPSRNALVSYATWLHFERRAVCRELYPHLGDKADQFVIGDHGMTAFDYHRDALHGPASARALDVLALAGCDWKDGKAPLTDDIDGRYIPNPDLAALEQAFRAAQGTAAENGISTSIMQATPHTIADLVVKARTLRACEPDWFDRRRVAGQHGAGSSEYAAAQIADGVAALVSMGAIDGQASVGGPSETLTVLLDAHQLAYARCLHAFGEEGADIEALKAAEEEAFRALLHTPLLTDADRAAYAQAVIERQTGALVAGRSIGRDHPLAVAYRNLRFGEHIREAPDQFEDDEPGAVAAEDPHSSLLPSLFQAFAWVLDCRPIDDHAPTDSPGGRACRLVHQHCWNVADRILALPAPKTLAGLGAVALALSVWAEGSIGSDHTKDSEERRLAAAIRAMMAVSGTTFLPEWTGFGDEPGCAARWEAVMDRRGEGSLPAWALAGKAAPDAAQSA